MKIHGLILLIITILITNVVDMYSITNNPIVTVSYEATSNETKTEFIAVLNIKNPNDEFLEIDLGKTNLTFEIVDDKGIVVKGVEYITTLNPKRPILTLRPELSINIQIGKISFSKKVKHHIYGIEGTGNLMVNNKLMDFATKGQLVTSELLLEIKLESTRTSYKAGGKPDIIARITNQNDFPIALMNKFIPTKDYFDIKKDFKPVGGKDFKESEAELHLKSLETLPTNQLWLWLYPGENVDIPIDVEIKDKGEYEISVEYTRKILIKKKGLEPYYTEQFKWSSNQLKINIQ